MQPVLKTLPDRSTAVQVGRQSQRQTQRYDEPLRRGAGYRTLWEKPPFSVSLKTVFSGAAALWIPLTMNAALSAVTN